MSEGDAGATAPVRIALVGCGRISRNHFDAIAKIEALPTVRGKIVRIRMEELN